MRPRRTYTFLAIAVFPAFFILQNPKISEPVHSFSLSLLKPFLLAGHSGTEALARSRSAVIQFWKAFRSQEKTEARIAELESRLIHLDEALRENERLEKLLAFKKSIAEKAIAARVIGWDPSPWRRTVILDKGKKQGLKKNMAVVVPAGLVGRIVEVGGSTSRAILLTDPDARVSVLADQSRAQGVIMGDGSPQLKIGYLDLNGGVAVEETVLTSGVGGLFPKGLRIGKITSLGKEINGLQLMARVQPFVSFSKLEEVLCLESSQPE